MGTVSSKTSISPLKSAGQRDRGEGTGTVAGRMDSRRRDQTIANNSYLLLLERNVKDEY